MPSRGCLPALHNMSHKKFPKAREDEDGLQFPTLSSDGSHSSGENYPNLPRSASVPRSYSRNRSTSNVTNLLLVQLLARESRDAEQINSMLTSTSDQLERETRRADEAERRALTAVSQLRTVTEAKRSAEQEVARLCEELRLYRFNLETAQREILRAQQIVDEVEAARKDAEADAARSRSIARKFKEERLVDIAREEGRRLGYREGLSRGRQIGHREGRALTYGDDRVWDGAIVEQEEEEGEEEYERDAGPLPSRYERDQRSRSPPTHSAPQPAPTHASGTRRPAEHVYCDPDVAPHAPTLPVPTVTTPMNLPSPSHAPASPSSVIELPNTPEPTAPHEDGRFSSRQDARFQSFNQNFGPGRPPPRDLTIAVPPYSAPSHARRPGTAPPAEPSFPPQEPITVRRPRDYMSDEGEYTQQRATPPFRPSSRTSTRISEFDLVSHPSQPSRSRHLQDDDADERQHRRRTIDEYRPSSPHTLHVPSPGPAQQNHGAPSSSGDKKLLRTSLDWLRRRRLSRTTSSPAPAITVEPPSGTVSTSSSGPSTRPNLLSPEHANRPLPAAPVEEQPSSVPVILMPDGELPPGFVPYGNPVRSPSPRPPAGFGQHAASNASVSTAPLDRPISLFDDSD